MITINIYGSNGTFTVNANTGEVIEKHKNEDSDWEIFDRIVKFDIEEYKKYYEVEDISKMSIDILSIGYWYKGERDNDINLYEEPAHDWREMSKEEI